MFHIRLFSGMFIKLKESRQFPITSFQSVTIIWNTEGRIVECHLIGTFDLKKNLCEEFVNPHQRERERERESFFPAIVYS